MMVFNKKAEVSFVVKAIIALLILAAAAFMIQRYYIGNAPALNENARCEVALSGKCVETQYSCDDLALRGYGCKGREPYCCLAGPKEGLETTTNEPALNIQSLPPGTNSCSSLCVPAGDPYQYVKCDEQWWSALRSTPYNWVSWANLSAENKQAAIGILRRGCPNHFT